MYLGVIPLKNWPRPKLVKSVKITAKGYLAPGHLSLENCLFFIICCKHWHNIFLHFVRRQKRIKYYVSQKKKKTERVNIESTCDSNVIWIYIFISLKICIIMITPVSCIGSGVTRLESGTSRFKFPDYQPWANTSPSAPLLPYSAVVII